VHSRMLSGVGKPVSGSPSVVHGTESILSLRRAALVEPVGGHSGAHYYDFGLCKGLISSGWRVALYTCDETENPHIPGLNFRPFFRDIYKNRSRVLRALRFVTGSARVVLSSLLEREKIFHYQVFNDLLPEAIMLSLALLCRRRIILTVHDVSSLAGDHAWKRRITSLVYRSAQGIIVHNEVSRTEVLNLGLSSEKIKVIPHGHYLDSMQPLGSKQQARGELGIEPSAKVILFFGQIKAVKGLDLLIEALPSVIDNHPETVLLIAGRPWKADFAEYKKRIDKNDLRDRCHLHIDFIPDNDVARFYAAADLVALPYRRIYQSGVLMMAMTHGRPVVVSDLPGMTEIVTDGENGFVFRQGSKDDLARVLNRALDDKQRREQVAARASTYIREKHDWNLIGKKITNLYLEVGTSDNSHA
jgi:D-inositol-3-phosphate glycosyltransferase